ncbi:hypothetical protein [Xanthomonas phage DES1]|nr:hypothetical protein [Xanthomonas phage DES1]
MNELKLYTFLEKSEPQFVEGLLKMFYHAALTNKIGIAEVKGELFLVGIEDVQEGTASYFPLAKILKTEEATELTADE